MFKKISPGHVHSQSDSCLPSSDFSDTPPPAASQIAKFLLWFACLFLPSFFLFFILFLIGGKLLYNIVLVSAIHQHESATGYTYVPSLLNLPRTSDPTVPLSGCHRTPGLNSLHHTANSHWLAVLNMVMYMFQCHSFNLSHPLLPTLGPQVCSLCLHLHCCPANRFISTIFLDSIYIH